MKKLAVSTSRHSSLWKNSQVSSSGDLFAMALVGIARTFRTTNLLSVEDEKFGLQAPPNKKTADVTSLLSVKPFTEWSSDEVVTALIKGAGLSEAEAKLLSFISGETLGEIATQLKQSSTIDIGYALLIKCMENGLSDPKLPSALNKTVSWVASLVEMLDNDKTVSPLISERVVISLMIDPVEEYLKQFDKKEGKYNMTTQQVLQLYDWARSRFGDFVEFDILEYLEQVDIPKQMSKLSIEYDNMFSTGLPLKKDVVSKQRSLLKQYLPFIPSLHLKTKFDEYQNSNAIIIAPSGTGKTGLLVRNLCRHPGILLTGTDVSEALNQVTTDNSVRMVMEKLTMDRVNCFAFSRQYVQILLLSKLIHIIHLINYAKNDESVKDTFEGKLLPFLVFNQFNGSTLTQADIFNKIVDKLKYCPLDALRVATRELIRRVKISTGNDQFYICLDEANVIEEYGPRFISINGNMRGALSIFTSEITSINTTNLFAGTSFSVDVSKIIQSVLGKTELTTSILQLNDFEYLNREQFVDYCKRHVIISEEDRKTLHEDSFPIRIRQAALALEIFVNQNLFSPKTITISDSLDEALTMMKRTLKLTVRDIIDSYKEDKEYMVLAFKQALFDYMIHYSYPELMGDSFMIRDNIVALKMLTSGVACPIMYNPDGETLFKANDALGYTFAQEFLQSTLQDKPLEPIDLAIYVASFEKGIRSEEALCLALIAQNEKEMKDLFSNAINRNVNLDDIMFHCKMVMTSESFKRHCISKKIILDTTSKSGEELYFELMATDPEFLVEILFKPSPNAHPDAILLTKKTDGSLVLLMFSFKHLTGQDLKLDFDYKSISPYLMYLDNYSNVTLSQLTALECNMDEKLEPRMRGHNFVLVINQLIRDTATEVEKKRNKEYKPPEVRLNEKYEWWPKVLAKNLPLLKNYIPIIIHPKTGKLVNKIDPRYSRSLFLFGKEHFLPLFGNKFTETIYHSLKKLEKKDKTTH